MLANIGLDEAQFVGEQERLPVLRQTLAPVFVLRMDGHGEEAELHGELRFDGIKLGLARSPEK